MHDLLHPHRVQSLRRRIKARGRDVDKVDAAFRVALAVVLDFPRAQVTSAIKVHRESRIVHARLDDDGEDYRVTPACCSSAISASERPDSRRIWTLC